MTVGVGVTKLMPLAGEIPLLDSMNLTILETPC